MSAALSSSMSVSSDVSLLRPIGPGAANALGPDAAVAIPGLGSPHDDMPLVDSAVPVKTSLELTDDLPPLRCVDLGL